MKYRCHLRVFSLLIAIWSRLGCSAFTCHTQLSTGKNRNAIQFWCNRCHRGRFGSRCGRAASWYRGGNRLTFVRSEITVAAQEGNTEGDVVYDLVVIGAGPVGVQAAEVASSPPYNKRVCLVDAPRSSGVLMDERNNVDLSIGGPTGLFSKALRDTSKRIKVQTLRGMGLREDSIWNEITTSCLELASANANDVRRQLDFAGVVYKEGYAEFLPRNAEKGKTNFMAQFMPKASGPDTIGLNVTPSDGKSFKLSARNVLLATGSRPFAPKGIPFDGERIFDSDSINQLGYLPKSIAITGSGIIAIEFAKIFKNLGADLTLIIRDKIPRNALQKIGLDKDIAATLVADLVRSGINIERGATVTSFDVPTGTNVRAPITLRLEATGGGPRPTGCTEEVKCDAYLAAVGRTPNTDKLNAEAAGVELDEYGGIKVDSDLQTTAPNVYAAGDILGRPFLASTGVAQGVAAVGAMFGDAKAFGACESDDGDAAAGSNGEDDLCIDGNLGSTGAAFDPTSLAANPFAFPVGVWSSPEAAYYGLSRQQAEGMGIDAGEGIALYAECLRGLVFSPNGLLKLVFEKPAGRILGVHICGDDACELIHYGMELVRAKRTITDVIGNLYSAVTFHEMYRIAAVAGVDEAGARKRRAAAGAALAAANRAKMLKGKDES